MPHATRWIPACAAASLAAVASLAQAQAPASVQEFQCRGEEPFWGLAGTRAAAVYSMPGPKGKREVVFRGALQTVTAAVPAVLVWRGDSTHLPKDTLVVILREEVCKPIAADAPALTHRAVLSLKGNDALVGCCSVRLGALAPPAPAKRAP